MTLDFTEREIVELREVLDEYLMRLLNEIAHADYSREFRHALQTRYDNMLAVRRRMETAEAASTTYA